MELKNNFVEFGCNLGGYAGVYTSNWSIIVNGKIVGRVLKRKNAKKYKYPFDIQLVVIDKEVKYKVGTNEKIKEMKKEVWLRGTTNILNSSMPPHQLMTLTDAKKFCTRLFCDQGRLELFLYSVLNSRFPKRTDYYINHFVDKVYDL